MKNLYRASLLLLVILPIMAFKIDRVIVSSDANPDYLDFWPVVAKAWNHLGVKPTLAFIAEKTIKVDETLGDVIQFEPIPGVSNGLYAQTVRLLIPILYEHDVCLISDIDMIPISKNYFFESVASIEDNKFVVFRDKAYSNCSQQYPMCYNAAKGSVFKEIFGISFAEEIPTLVKQWAQKGLGWSTDERMLYACLHQWKDFDTHCILLAHTVTRRIDRSAWHYDEKLLGKDHYIDCHSMRPYKKYKVEIDKLAKLISLTYWAD